MKAKCPYCQGGCAKCDGGYIEVRFVGKVQLWFLMCLNCDQVIGGCFSHKDPKISQFSCCPECKPGKNLVYVISQDSVELNGGRGIVTPSK